MKTDKELKIEVKQFATNIDRLAAEQKAARKARLEAPENVEAVERIQSAMEIAEQLYKARKEANITQKELAERLNTSQAAIARMERGRLNLTIQTVIRYAAACGKKVAIL